MTVKITLLAMACMTLTAGVSQAADQTQEAPLASIAAIKGSVLLNQGQRYEPIRAGMPLAPGDRVLAVKDGVATVTFRDGCRVEVKPGKLLTVGPQSPCAEPTAAAEPDIAAGDTIPGSNDHRPPNKTPPDGNPWLPIAVVGGLVGVGMGASCLADGWPCDHNHHNRSSVSP